MCFQYPNLPKEFLIQYHTTNKVHMKHKVKLLLTVTTRNLILVCYILPFISGSRASNNFILIIYSSTIAWHNSGMKVEIVLRATRKPNCSVGYLSPAAKCRKVIASFKPGSKDFLHNVSFFWISGPTLFNSSSNISGGIRRKLKNECTRSILSSAIRRSYWPYCSLLSEESQRCTHMDILSCAFVPREIQRVHQLWPVVLEAIKLAVIVCSSQYCK